MEIKTQDLVKLGDEELKKILKEEGNNIVDMAYCDYYAEGFEIKTLPQSVKISLPENIGYYQYQISKFSNTINLVTELKVDKAFVPEHLYLELKTFFDELMKKELGNIVIIKIN